MMIRSFTKFLILFLICVVKSIAETVLHPGDVVIDQSQLNSWEQEIENSLKRNIKGQCTWKYTSNMNQSYIGDSETHFIVRRFVPSKVDMYLLKSLPETFTQAHKDLEINAKLRGYSYESWGQQAESRWEVPNTHPGQNRNNCLAMSFLAAEGKPISFYSEFRGIDRAFYISYIRGGFVHPSGAVGAACGYYMGEECCENRWDYANEWYSNCQNELKKQNLTWDSLWDLDLPPEQRHWLIENCTDHRDLGLPYNGRVDSHIPKIVSKVFVIPALWDYNYHHFIADSLARLAHSLRYLRRNPDVFIHVRNFEIYDHMRYRDTKYAENANLMRCRLLELLGINCSRVITGMVLAEDVIIPRCTRCAYSLSNPNEIKLLRKLLIQASVAKVKEIFPHNYFQQFIPSLQSQHRQHPHHKAQQEIITQQMHLLPEPAHVPGSHVYAAKYAKQKYTHSKSSISKNGRRKLEEIIVPSKASPPRNLTMIILHRWSPRTTDRDWDDNTLADVSKALKAHFPNHHQVILSSKATNSPDYCLACDILQFARADIVVGAHGAGMTNLMFLPPHALLIEIVGEFKDVNMPVCGYYGPMSSMFGVHHFLYVHGMTYRENQPPMVPEEMAKGAAAFYHFLRDQSVKQPGVDFIRITNSTGGPMSCRP